MIKKIAWALALMGISSLSLNADKKPMPQLILSAKTVMVIARVGNVGTGKSTPSAVRAKRQVEKQLRKWGRYDILEGPKADLIVVVVERSTVPNDPTFMASRTFPMTASKNVLSDTLAVFKGGGASVTSEPLWARTETGDDFTWPAERAIKRFREEVEKARK